MRGYERNGSRDNFEDRGGSDTSRKRANKLQKSSTDSEDDDISDENARNGNETNGSNERD